MCQFVDNSSRTISNELVKDCFMYINCVAADNIFRRKVKFLNKIKQANNSLCRLFVAKMCDEITTMESCVVSNV